MNEHHPILDLCLDKLTAGEAEPLELKADAKQAIGGALEQLAGRPELVSAVLTLVEFAHFMRQEQKSPRAATSLLRIVAETSTEALVALGKAGAKVADELASERETFRQYVDTLPKTVDKPKPPTKGQSRSSPLSRFELSEQFDKSKKPKQ